MTVLDPRELNRALLARQLLLERQDLGVGAALERLVCLQAQAPDAPYVGLWSRLADFEPAQLAEMLLERRALRMTLMRGTVHLGTTPDALGLRAAVQPVMERLFASTSFARNLDGLDIKSVLARASELLREPRTRRALGRELGTRWRERDAVSLAQAATYLLPVVQVPPRGVWGRRGQATFMHVDAWVSEWREAEVSAETLFLRYLAAFGPASAQDFTVWSGLSQTLRIAEQLRPRLLTFRDSAGRELFDIEDAPRPDPDTPAPPRFLPEYDNLLLSHKDRSRVIEDDRKPPLPAGNGATMGTVLIDGFMRGEWKLENATLHVTPWVKLGRAEHQALEAEAHRLLALIGHGSDAKVAIATPG